MFDTLEAGADAKATRVLNKLADTTEIRLKGDTRNGGEGEGRIVRGTLGQGTNYAPGGIGLTSSKAVEGKFPEDVKEKYLAAVGDTTSDAMTYVDDISTFPKNEPSLRKVSVMLGDALKGISLESHPTKTEIIVSGRSMRAEKMRERLNKKHAVMQGNPIKVSSTGMYLGMKISDQGFRDTIDKTARHRVAKAWGRVAEIKSVINDARMSRVGWLRAGITYIRATIIPSITYSSEVWLSANKSTEKYIADKFKSMVYMILDLKTHTKISSVLADLGLPNITSVIDKLRINFMNHTLWEAGDTKLKQMLLEEKRLTPKNNLIEFTDEVCIKHKIPPVSKNHLDKRLVKRSIKLSDETETWMKNIKSTATKNVGLERVRQSTNFHILSKKESQSIIAYHAGAFMLKTAWGDFHKDQSCLAPMCGGEDRLEHIQNCKFYRTRWREAFESDQSNGQVFRGRGRRKTPEMARGKSVLNRLLPLMGYELERYSVNVYINLFIYAYLCYALN